jgi:hypothetical protein
VLHRLVALLGFLVGRARFCSMTWQLLRLTWLSACRWQVRSGLRRKAPSALSTAAAARADYAAAVARGAARLAERPEGPASRLSAELLTEVLNVADVYAATYLGRTFK